MDDGTKGATRKTSDMSQPPSPPARPPVPGGLLPALPRAAAAAASIATQNSSEDTLRASVRERTCETPLSLCPACETPLSLCPAPLLLDEDVAGVGEAAHQRDGVVRAVLLLLQQPRCLMQ